MKPRAVVEKIRTLCTIGKKVHSQTVLSLLDQIEWDDDGPELGNAGEFEARVREELTRLAPPGTAYTDELGEKIKTHMVRFVSDELARVGLPPAFAALIAAGIKIKKAT